MLINFTGNGDYRGAWEGDYFLIDDTGRRSNLEGVYLHGSVVILNLVSSQVVEPVTIVVGSDILLSVGDD